MNDCTQHLYNAKQCYCEKMTAIPDDYTVTMAYVPFQLDTTMFEPDVALCKGTLYTTLYKPFCKGALK